MKSKTDNPLITFALFAYNQESFIREALEGAFSQTYSPLEIILSDDCSIDHTFEIMKEGVEAYKGPHTLLLNRNEKNLGIGAHVNRFMEIARGELIVAAAGDDISIPERVSRIYQVYTSTNSSAKSIYSNGLIIDKTGKPHGFIYEPPVSTQEYSPQNVVMKDLSIIGCSHAWGREIFDVFGPMITPLTLEDQVIAFRSALLGQVKYIHEALMMHRRHDKNVWNRMKKDVERDIEFERFWIFERKAIYKNWVKDMQIMEKISPDRKKELKYLQGILGERLLDIEEDIVMLNGRFIEKAGILAKDRFKKGANFRIIRHKIGYFLIPKIYRKYLKVRIRIENRFK